MKKIQSVVAILLLLILVITVDQFSGSIMAEEEAEELVFLHDQVIDVNITIDTAIYQEMLDNATEEEYVIADMTYNGETFYNVAIRPKGNSSLRDVASSDSDRYSLKIDFDKYIEGQNISGITKLNLNNIFSDDTLMAEYLSYEMLEAVGAVAPDTTYVALSINDEYFGLYLAVEEVNEEFLMDNYGNADGQLYKPDTGVGSDLAYISDNPEDYTGIEPQDDEMSTDENFVELVTVIDQIILSGGETDVYKLSDILNVDSFLSYLAMSSATVHLDSYQGTFNHNYYLYFNTETELFEWIAWDLNMTFNGFPGFQLSDEEATAFLIDEPVANSVAEHPLVEAVFTNEAYVDAYHDYLEILITDYMSDDNFEVTVLETYNMIESYASIDPSAFFSIDEVKASLFDEGEETTYSLLEFVSTRTLNIRGQLDGSITSTNNGEGHTGSTGGMKGGRGQQPVDGDMAEEGQRPVDGDMAEEGQRPVDGDMAEEGQGPADGEVPEEMQAVLTQMMTLYENGELSDELSTYIANDEMPPPDLMIAELEALGVELPTMDMGQRDMENNDGADQIDRTQPMGIEDNAQVEQESAMSTENIIAFVASFVIMGVLSLYLTIRKY